MLAVPIPLRNPANDARAIGEELKGTGFEVALHLYACRDSPFGKRVRLAVRRRSNGRQIPWESTSLEEVFYFKPPKELKKLAEAVAQRRFEEELASYSQS